LFSRFDAAHCFVWLLLCRNQLLIRQKKSSDKVHPKKSFLFSAKPEKTIAMLHITKKQQSPTIKKAGLFFFSKIFTLFWFVWFSENQNNSNTILWFREIKTYLTERIPITLLFLTVFVWKTSVDGLRSCDNFGHFVSGPTSPNPTRTRWHLSSYFQDMLSVS